MTHGFDQQTNALRFVQAADGEKRFVTISWRDGEIAGRINNGHLRACRKVVGSPRYGMGDGRKAADACRIQRQIIQKMHHDATEGSGKIERGLCLFIVAGDFHQACEQFGQYLTPPSIVAQ